jgi:hypothetical protein
MLYNPMSWQALGWLFAGAVTLHNAEEAIWLPAFSRKKGYWRISLTVAQVRGLLLLLTILAYVCAWLSAAGNVVGMYLLCSYAVVMLVNVLVPHLIATIALREYTPGTGTALCLNLPVSWLLLHQAFAEKRIAPRTFAWEGPLLVILVITPLLFLLVKARK